MGEAVHQIETIKAIYMTIATIKKYLRQSGNIQSLTGNVVYASFSLVLFLLLVRHVGKELYGEWVIFMTVASIADLFRTGLAGTGAIRKISISQGIDRSRQVASSYYLAIFSTGAITLVFLMAGLILRHYNSDSFYYKVFLYYPMLGIANLSLNQALQYSQGAQDFKRVMIVRSAGGLLNLLIPGLYIFYGMISFEGLVISYTIASLAISLFTLSTGWDGSRKLGYFNINSIRELSRFGKYATLSTLSSSLLRSSDAIIISLAPLMGASAVAIYAIPFKVVELVEIPLRSFTATVYPKLSRAIREGPEQFNRILYQYLTYTIVLLFPVLLSLMIFPDTFLKFMGGTEYADSLKVQKQILSLLLLYILLLPLDRYLGMALFALDKPRANFTKIIYMLSANVVLDLLAVFVFRSLVGVAAASLFFTIIGIIVGKRMIFVESGFRLSKLISGFEDIYYSMILSIKSRIYVHRN